MLFYIFVFWFGLLNFFLFLDLKFDGCMWFDDLLFYYKVRLINLNYDIDLFWEFLKIGKNIL